MRILFTALLIVIYPGLAGAQTLWTNVDNDFGPLPKGVHVYSSTSTIQDSANRAFYISIPLKNRRLKFDALSGTRKTPSAYYNEFSQPLVVVNATFFSLSSGANLNLVISHDSLKAYNIPVVAATTRVSTESVSRPPTRSI